MVRAGAGRSAPHPLEPLLSAREDSWPRCPPHHRGLRKGRLAGLAALARDERGSESPGRPPS